MASTKKELRHRRKLRIRSKIFGTQERPRLVIFRSLSQIYAQLINDENGKVLVAASSLKVKSGKPMEKAKAVGKAIAEAAKAKKVTSVVFDRSGYLYHGRVKALADAAREGGLQF